MDADMLKKLLQAGALAAEAGSRGSAGNIASKIVTSGLDFNEGFKGEKTENAAGKPNKTNRRGKYSTDDKGRDYDDPMYGT